MPPPESGRNCAAKNAAKTIGLRYEDAVFVRESKSMIRSRDRILTTHVGSLPRNEHLSELLVRREAGESYDKALFDSGMEKAIGHVVTKQKEAGIDIGNDGEQQRVGFQTYVPQRMAGFGGESKRRRGREFEEFPELVSYLTRRFPNVSRQQNAPQAVGELHYHDTSAIEHEIARYLRIAREGTPFAESFMTAPSPGIIASTMLNAFYDSNEAYLAAIAREMRHEYQAIHEAGLVLQIDAPDLAMDRTMFYRDGSDADFVKACELHVTMINNAIAGIPPERVRLHICYGNWEGPHIHDIALEKILPALYAAKVGALSIEFSNPRHAHEYTALKRVPFPREMILMPGVVETTSNFVEHPEVVARRIEEAVAAIGDRERVIASTDCGFGTFTRREWVIEPVVWLKLRSIREGADIATARLWGRKSAA
jgi:5-methyltetrahydropteroyltriglutamate--homocysteine methyltransferase